jgi:protein-S-isoprenylcysteine O-methyltransferase Ste14
LSLAVPPCLPTTAINLATTGIFGLVLHPIYSDWIVFLIPGLALLSWSWPILLTPVVAYAFFKLSIRKEDQYLEKHCGQAYRDYKAQVNELFPIPRR